MDAQSGKSWCDLYCAFIDSPSGLLGRVQYNCDRFSKSTIENLCTDLRSILEVVTVHPEECLSRLPVSKISLSKRETCQSR
jgi:hypothetical protein